MTPLQFEAAHAPEWKRLEKRLDDIEARRPTDAAAAAHEYRRLCEQLALVRARAWPLHLAARLDALAARAHRLVYRAPPAGADGLRRFVLHTFPQVLRQRQRYLWAATLAFVLPMLAVGIATRLDPAFALTVLDAGQLAQFDHMYGDASESIGRRRGADTDWEMLGFYIRNNISVAFQCFATGLLAGIGSLFFLAINGALGGAVAGYLDARGLGHHFWPFVATHSAFELTAIVIAGAAGLRLGHALLAPGALTRVAALRAAGRDGAVLVGGATVMLAAAAVLEAFWSSARWVPAEGKYMLAALAWAGVMLYLWRAGRGDAH